MKRACRDTLGCLGVSAFLVGVVWYLWSGPVWAWLTTPGLPR